MNGFSMFVSLLAVSVYALISSPQSDLDIPSLNIHILKLEETVSSLQSQSQVQEQKYSAVLSSVLAKLTETTDELTSVQTDLTSLKSDYKSLKSGLETVKAHALKNEETIANISESTADNFTDVKNSLQAELTAVKSQLLKNEESILKVSRSAAVNLTNIQADMMDLTSDIEKCKENVTTLQSSVYSMKSDLNVGLGLNTSENLFSTIMSKMAATILDVEYLKHNLSDVHLLSATKTLNLLQTDAAFEVAQYSHYINVSTNEVIKFNTQKYNSFNHYNMKTGKFTVPVTGTYLFWFTGVISPTSAHAMVYIETTGGTILGFANGHGTLRLDSITGITVACLQQGKEVWFTAMADIEVGYYSHYGGALLTPKIVDLLSSE